MRVRRIVVSKGLLRSVVVGSAALLENVLKLKLGEIAEGLFRLEEEHIKLAQVELSAPGRELAYIIQARKRFG
jgi:hypothetical protein